MSARAYRVAPRRRTRGRPASRIHWDRLGRVVLVLVLFVILFSYINPVVNFVDAWRDSHAQREPAAAARAPSTAAGGQGRLAQGPRRRRPRQARKLGMVAPGERSYVVRGLHSAPPGSGAAAPDGAA